MVAHALTADSIMVCHRPTGSLMRAVKDHASPEKLPTEDFSD